MLRKSVPFYHILIRGIVFYTLFTATLTAQTNITFNGRILDKTTGEPLQYVSIDIPSTGTGVTTNEYGEFTYHFPRNDSISKIRISLIGYKKIFFDVASVIPDKVHTFYLIPEIKELKEVEITSKKGAPALYVVNKAIEKINENYPLEKFQLYGFYRDYIRETNTTEYINLTEAAIVIEDRGFNTSEYQRSKIHLEQIRYNPGFIADSSLNSAYDYKKKYIPYAVIKGANELVILRQHDPIRNHGILTFSFVDVFDVNFIWNHNFYYKSIIQTDSSKIYEIGFETMRILNFKADTRYWVKGEIFINSKDLAILKFHYAVDCKLPGYRGKFLDLKLEYKNFRNKYFLNYLSLSNYFEYKTTPNDSLSKAVPKKYFQYRELFVNKIITKPFKSMDRSNSISKETALIDNKIPVIPNFWEYYNYISNVKLME